MTILALEEVRIDQFERNFELYRDLSLVLRERITALKADGTHDPDCKGAVDAVKAHHRALQTVLELEAGLVKRSRNWAGGGEVELDLDAARAEILARLAVWSEGR